MISARISGAVIAVLILGNAACSEEVIVLGSIASTDGGSSIGIKCVTSSECAAGDHCDRRRCGEPGGTCQPFPISCANDEAPVCGCDGITYFNDCLRRAAGVEASDPEECGARGVVCKTLADCPTGAACARLVGGHDDGNACANVTTGRCWSVPAQCPSTSGGRGDRWEDCVEGPGRFECIGTCAAIQIGTPFRRAGRCH